MIVFLAGINLTAPIVGGVIPDSPAESAGIRAGDEVIEINGKDGRLDFGDVTMAAVLSGKGEEVSLKIRRPDGSIKETELVAESLRYEKFRGFGIIMPTSLTIAALVAEDSNMLFATTGLLPNDRVKAVAGVDVDSYWQMQEIVQKTFAPDIAVLADRPEKDGGMKLVPTRLELSFAANLKPDLEFENELENICSIVPRLRISQVLTRQSFKEWLSSLLAKVGLARLKTDDESRLKSEDIIVAVADVENPTYVDLRRLTNEYKNKELAIKVSRTDPNGLQKCLTVPVVPRLAPDVNRVMIGIVPELDVEHAVVAKTIPTEQYPKPLKILSGATITAVDGIEVSNFFDVAWQLEKNAGQRVTIDWRLDEQIAGDVAIDVGDPNVLVSAYASFKQPVPFRELRRLYKAHGPIDAVMMGYKRTKSFIIQAYLSLQQLVSGLISPKELTGPVGILTMSYRIVSDQPFVYYVYFLGLISAFIAVFNFLPLPPLDGGLVLLLVIEKIKGSALSLRTQEIIAYAGWGLIGALFLYVTFNDFLRILFGF